MIKKILIIFNIVFFISFCDAFCFPWKSAGTINVCKAEGKQNCLGLSSGDTCINLTGGPFVSGFSGQSEACTIYSEVDCKGDSNPVDQAGWSRFPYTAKSIKCPCI
jgi:hypothetical protein